MIDSTKKWRNGWQGWHFVLIGLLVGLSVYFTFDALAHILHIALNDNDESSHIMLVPFVAAWLIWVRRGRWRYCKPGPTILGPMMIAVGWWFTDYGFNHGHDVFWHGGALLAVMGAAVTLLGHDVVIKFLPVFVVALFLIPVPGSVRQSIAIPLQNATAQATKATFDLIGSESIQLSGNLLYINGVSVEIAEACNGMRMVFALLLVSFAFAFGTPLRMYARLLVVAVSPISAIVCNVIRLIPTIWFYGRYSNDTATMVHDIGGWIMLPLSFLILMAIINLLRWALIPVSHYTLAYD